MMSDTAREIPWEDPWHLKWKVKIQKPKRKRKLIIKSKATILKNTPETK